jgi:anti-sigma-K factor RskA
MRESHEELKSSIAAYVLGAVSDDKLPRLRAHILRCDECFEEANSYAEVVAAMHETVEPTPLPAGFASRVISSVQTKPATKARRGTTWDRWRLGLAVGATALAMIFGVGLIDARSDLADRDRVFNALVREDGLAMTGASGAVARVVPEGEGSVLVVAGLPDTPDEHTYQLWLLEEGADPESAGTFEVEDGVAIFESEREMSGFEGAAVTLEPEGGSPAPTSDPILASA